jgi:hypothetical protein
LAPNTESVAICLQLLNVRIKGSNCKAIANSKKKGIVSCSFGSFFAEEINSLAPPPLILHCGVLGLVVEAWFYIFLQPGICLDTSYLLLPESA